MLLIVSLGCFLLSNKINAEASTGGYSQSDAVSWANGLVGQRLDLDGNGVECVDLIAKYYQTLGQGLVWGNAYQYANGGKYTPAGWTYTNTPSPGDIAVWPQSTVSPVGHVGIVTEVRATTFVYVDQNGGGNHEGVTPREKNTASSGVAKFIHPDFPAPAIVVSCRTVIIR